MTSTNGTLARSWSPIVNWLKSLAVAALLLSVTPNLSAQCSWGGTTTLYTSCTAVGVGTTAPTAGVHVNMTSQTPHIKLTGTEFYVPSSSAATGGMSVLLGVNRTANRQ